MKEKIITDILDDMSAALETPQIVLLKCVLFKNFKDIKVEEVTTEVSTINYSYNEGVLKRYMVTLKLAGRSEKTMKSYYYNLTRFFDLISKNANEIKESDIQEYIAHLMMSTKNCHTTINNKLSAIRPFFVWLYESGICEYNPFRNVKNLKNEKKVKQILSDRDMVLLRDYSNNDVRLLAMIDFLASTGVRVSEFINLKKDSINYENGEVTIYGEKTKTWRKAYLTANALKHLIDYINSRTDSTEFLFVNKKKPNSQLTRYTVEDCLKNAAANCGINKHCTVHLFRRTLATNLHREGMQLDYIARILGHSVSTLEKCYLVHDDEEIRNSYYKSTK